MARNAAVTVVGAGGDAARALGKAVRDARKDAGLTQEELGAFVGGMPRHMVADLEKGHLTRQAQRLLDILDVVGLELDVRPRSARLAQADDDVPGADPSP